MKIICMVILLLILGACTSMTPHENFIAHMNQAIGENVDEIPYYKFGNREYLISTSVLPNGNKENKYLYKHPLGECIYVFEVDKETNKVIRWRTEGDEKGCIVNP